MSNWNIDKARAAYNIANWGAGYFDVNEKGHLVAHPNREREQAVDLYEVAQQVTAAGLTLPVLVRFTDILQDRVKTLCRSFRQAMTAEDYQGDYTAVYPIKVNQQHSVVEEILVGGGGCVGLEAGSKPELMAVLGMSRAAAGVIVCNGYKDREYIRLALIGQKLGHRIYIVIEKLSELEVVLQEAAELKITPILGVRVRLASIGAGKWQNTGGEKSKFGLSAAQVLTMTARLQAAGMGDALQMLHFHLGSQLANIRDIQRGMHECARFYAELRQLGMPVSVVDVGGGLGVDYEGSRSRSACSMNYSVESYASHIVHILKEICEQRDLPHPHIFTESGRAMTAHHALLITNVIGMERVPTPENLAKPGDDEPLALQELWQSYDALSRDPGNYAAIEALHDIRYWLGEAQTLYTNGALSLRQRALAEEIYFASCRRIRELLNPSQRSHREALDELNEKLADKYFCNFSLFQSIPDAWAIDQVFPLAPLHRLLEEPRQRGVIEDITCDSDGRIDMYVDGVGVETSLPLHDFHPGEPYLLGVFLVGAYQEILGDMHNLFGDTDSLHVVLDDEGYHLSQTLKGDTVADLLRYVHFEPETLLARYRNKIEAAKLSDEDKQAFLAELESGLSGYTYLED